MKRAGLVWLTVGLLAAMATGDRVVLRDGRVFEGKVTESDGKVLIDLAYGTISFPAGTVESIQRMPTPEDLLEWQLSQVDRSDPDALYQTAAWAKDNDLSRQADDLLREVLTLDANHRKARKLLGYLEANQKWIKVPEALELAEGKLAAGAYDVLLTRLLPAIEELVDDAQQRLQVKHIESHCRLRAKQFELARKGFDELAEMAPPAAAARYGAIAGILARYPDGMYVVTEVYPPTAMVLSESPAPAVKAGPASLSRPQVLGAALRDRAKAIIKEGRSLSAQAKRLERTEPEAAKAHYAKARQLLDAADAIIPNIARFDRVEIARRQIAAVTKDVHLEAEKFDVLKGELGKRNLTPAAYRDLLARMVRALNHIRSDLHAILKIAEPFERELILEITDANGELRKIDALREVVIEELNASN